MKKLLILMSLAAFGTTGCGLVNVTPPNINPNPDQNPEVPGDNLPDDNTPTPELPPVEETPNVPEINFLRYSTSYKIGTDPTEFDWISTLGITTTNAEPLTAVANFGTIDYNFAWKNPISVGLTVSSGLLQVTKAINLNFITNSYTNDQIYTSLEKSVFKIKIRTGASTFSNGTAQAIDFDSDGGELIFATNHHVVMNGTSNLALLKHNDGEKMYLTENDFLPDICAEIIAFNPDARTSDIDLAFLKAVGTTNNGDCTSYTAKTNYNDQRSKVNILKRPKMSFEYYNSTISSYKSSSWNYFAIGYPNVVYKKETFKYHAMAQQQQMKSNNINTYKFDAMYFKTYFGEGSSGMPIVDENMVLVAINSQGFLSEQLQAGVMNTDIVKFTNDYYCPNVSSTYNGNLC